ncbi:PASTA domain-containing protein [Streptomyces sp. 2BBP-J2]|uniref:PASTA domain-containing protein n=1 Tax=unclassified Streptomyces TaxID=2593676 RepID=UPI0014320063|nr:MULTISPECIES: PASTA domain-containing protein [unclassified Streptomyces]NIL50942.1 PASTA domain-containing protein [Streptomyces sp. 2BBP-J2]WPP33166.1 PASTA domain-containing protein [Streptomyces sp. CL7]
MNPYDSPPPSPRPWWRTTPALLGLLALVALLSAVSLPLGLLVMVAVMVAVWVLPAWRWYARLGATFGAFFLMLISAGMSGQLDDSGPDTSEVSAQDTDDKSTEATPSPTTSKAPELTDYTGKALDEAEKGARAAGFTPGLHDASAEDRTIVVRSTWTVCFQQADTTAKSVAFAAVKEGEPCPSKDGEPLPWPTMPDVVGDTYNTAVEALGRAGIDLDSVTLDDVYLDIDAPAAEEAAEEGDEWRVCFQRPDENDEVTSTTTVHLDLGQWTDLDLVQECPSKKDTTYKIPANDPDYDDGSADDDSTTGGDSSSSDGGSSNVGTVHPGSYCSPPGATGVTKAGTPMVCGPGSDGRNRWRSS